MNHRYIYAALAAGIAVTGTLIQQGILHGQAGTIAGALALGVSMWLKAVQTPSDVPDASAPKALPPGGP